MADDVSVLIWVFGILGNSRSRSLRDVSVLKGSMFRGATTDGWCGVAMNAPGGRFLGLSTASKSSDDSPRTDSFGEGVIGEGARFRAAGGSGSGRGGAETLR